MGWGGLSGKSQGEVADHLYFSATSFSTLGIGDVYPTGAIRLISGFEAVYGLFLIAWSTSFTYLAMERQRWVSAPFGAPPECDRRGWSTAAS